MTNEYEGYEDGTIIAERQYQKDYAEAIISGSEHAEKLYQSTLLGQYSASSEPQGEATRLSNLEERVSHLERAVRAGIGSDRSPEGTITIDRHGSGGTLYGHTASGKKVMWSGVMGQGGKWRFV
jgi:hypothetical protein